MTRQSQRSDELQVFKSFAYHGPLPVVPSSIVSQDPPHPDVSCNIAGEGKRGFEIVEIIDEGLAKSLSIRDQLATSLRAQMNLQAPDGRFADARINVGLGAFFPSKELYVALAQIAALLKGLPPQFQGQLPPKSLPAACWIVIVSRGVYLGPQVIVDFVGDAGDRCLRAIRRKFAKSYPVEYPVELLAYLGPQPELPNDKWVEQVGVYVRENIRESAFSRIWVFNAAKCRVLKEFT